MSDPHAVTSPYTENTIQCTQEGLIMISVEKPEELERVAQRLVGLQVVLMFKDRTGVYKEWDGPPSQQVRMLTDNECIAIERGQRLPSGLLLAKDAIREFCRVNAGLTIPTSGKLEE